jgi:hypothetical protein
MILKPGAYGAGLFALRDERSTWKSEIGCFMLGNTKASKRRLTQITGAAHLKFLQCTLQFRSGTSNGKRLRKLQVC